MGPPEPPLPLQGQVCLVPHQHHGHAAGTGRIRAQTTLGHPPWEEQHLPCLPPALIQLLVEGLDHLEAVGTRGHPGTASPRGVPPVPGDPSLNLRGSSPPQRCHRVDQDVAVDADDEGVGQDGVLVLGGGTKPVAGVAGRPAAPQHPQTPQTAPALPARPCPPAAAGTHPCPPPPSCCRLQGGHQVRRGLPGTPKPSPQGSDARPPHSRGTSAPSTRFWGTTHAPQK